MTPQEIFDTVARHLHSQGQKSISDGDDNDCAYRGDNGLKCAVGALIADKHYSPTLEGRNCNSLDVQTALLRSGVDIKHPQTFLLLKKLQEVHDEIDVDLWRRYLLITANLRGLSSAVVDELWGKDSE